jgi:hypothetical protein
MFELQASKVSPSSHFIFLECQLGKVANRPFFRASGLHYFRASGLQNFGLRKFHQLHITLSLNVELANSWSDTLEHHYFGAPMLRASEDIATTYTHTPKC